MERLFIECFIRTALLVASTAIVLQVLRVKDAAARHKVWVGVVVAMLLLPAWTAWGPKATVRVLPSLPEPTPVVAVAPATRAAAPPEFLPLEMNAPPSPSPAVPRVRWTWQAILLGIYALGMAAFLLRLVIGIARAQQLVRRAVLRDGRLTSATSIYPGLQVQPGPVAAPVTVGWFRPRVILPEEWREWPQAKLDAVLLHEGEHARRRDPLWQVLALLNRAVFWFHPAAWWLEHRIGTLAEEACDDVVLARGTSPNEYSEYLMDMARAVARSGARVNIASVAMPGSSLPRRIKRIIEGAPVARVSRTRMACVAAACAIACTAFAAGTLDHSLENVPGIVAPRQSSLMPPDRNLPSFDSAFIRPRGSGPIRNTVSMQKQGVVTAINRTLRGLLQWAYPLRVAQDRVISGPPGFGVGLLERGKGVSIPGAPDWIDSERFDVEAKTASTADAGQVRLMLQSLLADKFKLAVHFDTEVVPIYATLLSFLKPSDWGHNFART